MSNPFEPPAVPPIGGAIPPRSNRPMSKAVLVVGAGVVVLALLISGVAFWSHHQQVQADKKVRQEATETVQGYLTAVSAGDAEVALDYAQVRPDGPLLADAVAKAAAKAAAIADILVSPAEATKADGTWTTATVHATYTLNGKPIAQDFPLARIGDRWKLAKVTATVTLGATELDYTINDVPVSGSTVEALPGTYAVRSKHPALVFVYPNLTVPAPGGEVTWIADSQPPEAALGAGVELLKSSFQKCLNEVDEVVLPNCPFSFKAVPGVVITPGSVRFGVVGDPFEGAKFIKVSETQYAMTVTFAVSMVALGKLNGQQIRISANPSRFQSTGTVDLGTDVYRWQRKLL